MKNVTLSDIINLAIQREQDAFFFYLDICDDVEDESVKDTLIWIADEEKKHRKFLIDYRNGKFGDTTLRLTQSVDYKIAEHLKTPEITTNMKSSDVFLAASHRELKSYEFYSQLSHMHPEGETKDLLMRIANEELKHKEKMEYLYTNTAFPQTSGG